MSEDHVQDLRRQGPEHDRSGGHVWERRAFPKTFPMDAWQEYTRKYVTPYGLLASKNPPIYFCDLCHTCVPESGPSAEDADCALVSARRVHES